MDYKKVLEHFKQQAEGKQKSTILNRKGRSNLIKIDFNDRKEILPKMQVVIPAEAATKRAESQLDEDIKEQLTRKVNQSASNSRTVKSLAKKRVAEQKSEQVAKSASDALSPKRWKRQ